MVEAEHKLDGLRYAVKKVLLKKEHAHIMMDHKVQKVRRTAANRFAGQRSAVAPHFAVVVRLFTWRAGVRTKNGAPTHRSYDGPLLCTTPHHRVKRGYTHQMAWCILCCRQNGPPVAEPHCSTIDQLIYTTSRRIGVQKGVHVDTRGVRYAESENQACLPSNKTVTTQNVI